MAAPTQIILEAVLLLVVAGEYSALEIKVKVLLCNAAEKEAHVYDRAAQSFGQQLYYY